MEWPLWRHLCKAGVCLALIGMQLGTPAEAGSGWQTLAPGMEIRSLQSRKQSRLGDSRITVLRIDPGLWELEITGTFQTGETAGHTAREWSRKQKYAVVINAGMFESDGKTHLGYMRSRDRVFNGKVNAYESVLAFDAREGKTVPGFQIFDLDVPRNSLRGILKNYMSAVQNLRLIKGPG